MNANSTRTVTKEDFRSVCRCCLSEGNLINIFESVTEDFDLTQLYKTLCSIEIILGDKMPQNMCKVCISELIHFSNFRYNCIKCETALRVLVTDNNCKINTKLENLDQNTGFEDNTVCRTVYLNNFSEELNCNVVDQNVTFIGNNSDEINCSNAPTNCDDRLKCDESVKTAIRRKYKPKIYKCPCDATFTNYNDYVEHRKIMNHYQPRKHNCPICERAFTSSHLKIHIRTHTDEKPFTCEICKEKFRSNSNFQRHVMTHTGEKSHICDLCKRGFTKASYLVDHWRTHTGEKPFSCHYCEQQFSSSYTYNVHLKRHESIARREPQKIYTCDICGKTFRKKSILNNHLLTHGEKTFLCSTCGKSFHYKNALQTHIRVVHLKVKPHSCEYCGKAFSRRDNFEKHKGLHLEQKSRIC